MKSRMQKWKHLKDDQRFCLFRYNFERKKISSFFLFKRTEEKKTLGPHNPASFSTVLMQHENLFSCAYCDMLWLCNLVIVPCFKLDANASDKFEKQRSHHCQQLSPCPAAEFTSGLQIIGFQWSYIAFSISSRPNSFSDERPGVLSACVVWKDQF